MSTKNQQMELKSIEILNNTMYNYEYFLAAIRTNKDGRRCMDLNKYQTIIELYAYLYKHSEFVIKLLSDDVYKNFSIIQNIHELMIIKDKTAAEAVKTFMKGR